MGCPAVTTSCCVLAWPLKLYLSRCHPRRSATVKARGQANSARGAAVGWPVVARTQQEPAQPAKVGVLYPGLASSFPSRITAFRDGLQAVGNPEPDNIEMVVRSARSDPPRIAPL